MAKAPIPPTSPTLLNKASPALSPATENAAAASVILPKRSTVANPSAVPSNLKDDVRRPSIQFRAPTNTGLSQGEPKLMRSESKRRMSSPPPPPVFQSRVSFDTWEKPSRTSTEQSEITSFTLAKKHKDYAFTKRSRTFLCGLDANDYSEYALEWLIDELVDDGDEVVCLRVVDPNSEVAVGAKGKDYREEAEALMKNIEERNRENKAVNLILEFAVGKVEKMFTRMIKLYEPAILIVGTRGRSLGGIQGLLPGSISKFCLQNSPIPVIVVRPNKQRARSKRKREKDAARHGYRDLLDKAGAADGIPGHLLDGSNQSSTIFDSSDSMPTIISAEDEAMAAAEAMGMKRRFGSQSEGKDMKGSPLVKMQTTQSDDTAASPDSDIDVGSEEASPESTRVMKSPELIDLESPTLSGEDEYPDDEEPSSPEMATKKSSIDEHSRIGGTSLEPLVKSVKPT